MLVWLPERIYHKLSDVAPLSKAYLDQINKDFTNSNSFIKKVKMVNKLEENSKYIEVMHILDQALNDHERKILSIINKTPDSETLKGIYENQTEHPLVRAYAFYFNILNIDIAKIGLDTYDKEYLTKGFHLFKGIQDKDVRIWLKEFQFRVESASIKMLPLLTGLDNKGASLRSLLALYQESRDQYVGKAYLANREYGITKDYVEKIFDYKLRFEIQKLFSLIIDKAVSEGGTMEEICKRIDPIDTTYRHYKDDMDKDNEFVTLHELITIKKLCDVSDTKDAVVAATQLYLRNQIMKNQNWADLFKQNVSFEKEAYQFMRSIRSYFTFKTEEDELDQQDSNKNQDIVLFFKEAEMSDPIAKELGFLN